MVVMAYDLRRTVKTQTPPRLEMMIRTEENRTSGNLNKVTGRQFPLAYIESSYLWSSPTTPTW